MKKVLVVVGPTAVGKTKISISLAKHYGIDIISGDSVAIYKRLDIGSAKPTKEEMDGVCHHFIDIKDPKESYSACDFQREARKKAAAVRRRLTAPPLNFQVSQAMTNLIKSVGRIQSGNPPSKSESAEPRQAARNAGRWGRNSTNRKMVASPRCA